MGGRGGASSLAPTGNVKNWSGNVGDKVSDTLKGAIGAKGKPFSIGDAVVKTNPNYNTSYAEFSMNCQRCVIAYELRRRGYDVTALPTYAQDKWNKVVTVGSGANERFEGRWKGAFKGAKMEKVGASTSAKTIQNIEDKMKQYGHGARGVVQIFYKNGGGHVFNVENVHGKIQFIEAQTGRVKDIKQTMDHVITRSVGLTRTDNLRVSDRARNFVKKRR